MSEVKIHMTPPCHRIQPLDRLNIPDRSLVDYEKYNQYIGQAMVKNRISLEASRGCPYHCLYCFKIWPKTHVFRSAQHLFTELKLYYDMGVRRFSFIDDIFNLNKENSSKFFQLIIKHQLQVQLFFPAGLRGDILTDDYIDLMVEAGTINFALALETASPRLQKLIGKHLDIKKLRNNIEYICQKYPQVILELFTMHGFPTETREEALATLDFINSIKWLHFPYVNILRIYPNTEMETFALNNGISAEAISRSENFSYHQLPETLPFEQHFTLQYQTEFLHRYFLSKERLRYVLPYQMKVLTEDEMVQKYNSYLPGEIRSFDDILRVAGINKNELEAAEFIKEEAVRVPDINTRMRQQFKHPVYRDDALRVLLLDLSQVFSRDSHHMLYDLSAEPLGLMSLLTYLNQQFAGKVYGKIAKSRIDFDGFSQLKAVLGTFQPDVIGVRTLNLYKDFFHKTIRVIKQLGIEAPIIAGGPYATSSYPSILDDKNVDVVVLGEGELTFAHLINVMINNGGKLPHQETLKEIPGIAFSQREKDKGLEDEQLKIQKEMISREFNQDLEND